MFYVDSLELRRHLAQLELRLPSGDGDSVGIGSDESGHIVTKYTVYVYNVPHLISGEISQQLPATSRRPPFPILLDGLDRAVAFDDMAIALRSVAEEHKLDHQCNGHQSTYRAREVDLCRDVLGAILSGLWGVAPTHLRWNPLAGGVDADWLWGVSNTPYGPFSSFALASSSSQVETGDTGPNKQRAHFSFVQRGVAQRNQIYATVQAILEDVRTAFANLSSVVAPVGGGYSYYRKRSLSCRIVATTISRAAPPAEMQRRAHALKSLYLSMKDELDHAATYSSILDFSHAMEYVTRARDAADSVLVETRAIFSSMNPVLGCVSH